MCENSSVNWPPELHKRGLDNSHDHMMFLVSQLKSYHKQTLNPLENPCCTILNLILKKRITLYDTDLSNTIIFVKYTICTNISVGSLTKHAQLMKVSARSTQLNTEGYH